MARKRPVSQTDWIRDHLTIPRKKRLSYIEEPADWLHVRPCSPLPSWARLVYTERGAVLHRLRFNELVKFNRNAVIEDMKRQQTPYQEARRRYHHEQFTRHRKLVKEYLGQPGNRASRADFWTHIVEHDSLDPALRQPVNASAQPVQSRGSKTTTARLPVSSSGAGPGPFQNIQGTQNQPVNETLNARNPRPAPGPRPRPAPAPRPRSMGPSQVATVHPMFSEYPRGSNLGRTETMDRDRDSDDTITDPDLDSDDTISDPDLDMEMDVTPRTDAPRPPRQPSEAARAISALIAASRRSRPYGQDSKSRFELSNRRPQRRTPGQGGRGGGVTTHPAQGFCD